MGANKQARTILGYFLHYLSYSRVVRAARMYAFIHPQA
jgi:hypothetical protein